MIILISGCQTVRKLGQIDCTRLDWYELGRTDGSTGLPPSRDKHEVQCLQALDDGLAQQYENGFQAGLTEYCSVTRGFEDGKSGRSNPAVCPWPLQERYISGYRIGSKIHDLQKENLEVDRKMSELLKSGSYVAEVTRQLDELREKKSANAAEILRLENQMTSVLL
jgi:hypothetical protein